MVAVAMLALFASPANAQTVQLAYKFRPGEVLTYSFRVEGSGTLVSSRLDGSVEVATALSSTLDMEFALNPIKRLEDGSYRVAIRITKFSQHVHLPDVGTDLRMFVQDDAFAVSYNGRLTVLPLPAQDTEEPSFAPPRSLATLAKLFSRPVHVTFAPNGEARVDEDDLAKLAARGVGTFGACQRFRNIPVQIKDEWQAKIPMVVPGVANSTIDARFTLESIDTVDHFRWARVSVQSTSALEGSEQPLFGCGVPMRIESLKHEVNGTLRFSVDQGRTMVQEMNMDTALAAVRLSATGEPVGKIRLDMGVRSRLDLQPSEAVPFEQSPSPDLQVR